MEYVKYYWKYIEEETPVLIFAELDEERYSVREVDVFSDRHMERFGENEEYVSEEPYPSNKEIDEMGEFKIFSISKEEFEDVWKHSYSSLGYEGNLDYEWEKSEESNKQNNEQSNETMVQRIDLWLVRHKNIESRSKAQALIRLGNVICNGKIVIKASQMVSQRDCIEISSFDYLKYVSRGGLKLEKAIQVFHLDFSGKKVLDIGSSTGGFTDCALQHGAKSVIAVDVGKKVMHPSLAEDIRVELHEETDIREFPLEHLKEIDYVVCDVSFISLLSVIKPLKNIQGDFELVLLIKPQFECGARIAKRYKGVILDKKVHRDILNDVIQEMRQDSFFLKEITYSPVCGGDGNIEYIAHFDQKESDMISFMEIDAIVENAFGSLKNKSRKK